MTKWKYFDRDITCTKLHSTHFHNTIQTKYGPAAIARTGTHLLRGLSNIYFSNYLSHLLLCHTLHTYIHTKKRRREIKKKKNYRKQLRISSNIYREAKNII